jgi:hypothetical protein
MSSGGASPDITLALEGSASTSAAGTVVPSSTAPLLGGEVTVSDGEITSDGGDAVAEVVQQRGRSGRRRYRIFEDPDRLEEQLRVEEKKVEKEKKKLKILINRVESPNVEGVLYQQIQAKVEKLEAKIDDRMEKIVGLLLAIQVGIDEQDDEEEVFLMS